MMKFILSILNWLFGGKKEEPKPPVQVGVHVVNVEIVTENGKKYSIRTYSDGSVEKNEMKDDTVIS